MEDSGLRGLGGAGFPAGRKWKIVKAEPAPRLLALNIDEGEPGTFKDRYYLERDPHRFIEGALIAAWAIGIEAIYIYLRDEYHWCRALLKREIAALQANPPCAIPPIYLRRGAGAYICGEESSMIESILVRGARPAWAKGPAILLCQRPCQEPGRASSPCGHHATGAYPRILRWDARWP
jgi:formate dehydrogenase